MATTDKSYHFHDSNNNFCFVFKLLRILSGVCFIASDVLKIPRQSLEILDREEVIDGFLKRMLSFTQENSQLCVWSYGKESFVKTVTCF